MPVNQRRVRIKDSNGDASPPRHDQGRQTKGGHTLFLRYEKKIAQVKHLRYRCLWQFHYHLLGTIATYYLFPKKSCSYVQRIVDTQLALRRICRTHVIFNRVHPHQSLKLLQSGKLKNRTKTPKGVPKLKCPRKIAASPTPYKWIAFEAFFL